ncbi:MAG: DNA polymerase III subunit delta [Patescibacteria group bacterium]
MTTVLLTGEDTLRSRRKLAAICKRFREEHDPNGMAMTTLSGGTPIGEARAAIRTSSFFGAKRMVVVEDLLVTRKKKEEVEAFAELFSDVPAETVLVLWEPKGRDELAKHLLYKRICAATEFVEDFAPLQGSQLEQFFAKELAELGGIAQQGTLRRFAEIVGSDLWHGVHELQKLVAFACGRMITTDDVDALVRDETTEGVFAFTDALGVSAPGRALSLLHAELEAGNEPEYLFALLVRQARLLLLAVEAAGSGLSAELPSMLGVPPFVARKIREQSRRFSVPTARALYGSLLAFDREIKTGRLGPVLALDRLAAEWIPLEAARVNSC